jgi:anti-sigma regulatory factor (Ser/Thr protein kinase)
LGELGFDAFDCVVSDYRMPGRSGLDLVDWLEEKKSNLATIMLTAEGEMNLVAESLRRGVVDFLEKPVSLSILLAALARAIGHTARRRKLARSDLAVTSLGRTQAWMLRPPRTTPGCMTVDLCFHPFLEAGGDFFDQIQVAPNLYCCLLSDVSGHDLRAAYTSAYFHGIFRGMLMGSTPLPQILAYFNEFLVNEWNRSEVVASQAEPAAARSGAVHSQAGSICSRIEPPDQLFAVGTSIAITSVWLDFQNEMATFVTCGAPPPVYVSRDNRAHFLGVRGGSPLGWFAELDVQTVAQSVAGGGVIFMWTDGLEDFAEARKVHPLCLAFVMQQARKNGLKLPWLGAAKDDILFAEMLLPEKDAGEFLFPIVCESYRGNLDGKIDEFADSWRRNLKLAISDLSEEFEHDILLATREAVLNAMKHGCRLQGEKVVSLQISVSSPPSRVQVWVDDPGSGHQFDFDLQNEIATQELIDEHRGLIFMKNLANTMRFERNGASLLLEFEI